MKFQFNPQAEPLVPTDIAYEGQESRHGKRNKGAKPVSKHRSSPRRVGSVSPRGLGGPNLARETNKRGERKRTRGKRMYIENMTKKITVHTYEKAMS